MSRSKIPSSFGSCPQSSTLSSLACPLCASGDAKQAVCGADTRHYFLCGVCQLIFVAPSERLAPEAEQAYYGTHENSVEDEGYVRFLNRLVEPMLGYLDGGMRGLDYGCGPGPTLSTLLVRQGIACEDYDPLFMDRSLTPPYDFIFASECVEHFHDPAGEFRRLHDLLRPGGLLAVMTWRWTTREGFANWHYTRDPTHVAFFHERTFDYICGEFGFERVWQDDGRVVILRRGGG